MNLAELAEEIVQLVEVAAEERDCRIRMRGQEGGVVTYGRDLLVDAIAPRHRPHMIKFCVDAAQVIVEVTDRDGVSIVRSPITGWEFLLGRKRTCSGDSAAALA